MRSKICALFLALAGGSCASPTAAVQAARQLDFTTSYAHMILRVAFDESPHQEDSADDLLLYRLAALDAADEKLSGKLERFETRTTPPADRARLRREIESDLASIDASYQEVTRLLQPRPAHEEVRHALAQVPADVQELRQQMAADQVSDAQ